MGRFGDGFWQLGLGQLTDPECCWWRRLKRREPQILPETSRSLGGDVLDERAAVGADLISPIVWHLRRGIDYFQSRPGFDSQRIGAL